MGVLTDDMTRLRGEIGQLDNSLKAFVGDLKEDVVAMRAHFRKAHRQMAKTTAAEREAFVSDLKERVTRLRSEFAADIAGAHRAWFGPSPAGPRPARRKTKRPTAKS
jgi:hypothetical protein